MNMFLERIHHLDASAFIWMNVTKGCQYRRLVRWISRTGDGYLYLLLGALLWCFGGTVGERFFYLTLFAYLIDVSAYLLLKNTIKRDRPSIKIDSYEALIKPSDKFSFPSGHTAGAFVFACMVATFFPAFTVPIFIWATLVGVSRVLLGVHYPTDIVAGSLLGCGSAYCALQFSFLLI